MSVQTDVAATQRPTLSLCMIVKDEAFFLEECLLSARPHVDQIVVLDTGLSDGTLGIARRQRILANIEALERMAGES